MADMDKLADGDRLFVARLLAEAPKLADAVVVAKRLHRMLRDGKHPANTTALRIPDEGPGSGSTIEDQLSQDLDAVGCKGCC